MQIKTQIEPLYINVFFAGDLSARREAVITGEERKYEQLSEVPLSGMVKSFCRYDLNEIWKKELRATFEKAKEQDEKAKAKGAGKGDAKKKAKKGAEEKPAGLQLGKGSRQFLDFLTQSKLTARVDEEPWLTVGLNKELESEMSEILQVHNQESRRPKCAKGTRDMTPLQMAIREVAFNVIRGVF